jgi:hypothetical protein
MGRLAMNKMSKRLILILAAVFAFAAIPAVALASGAAVFSATGTIVRVSTAYEGIDTGTGGLLTLGQVFLGNTTVGTPLGSDWDELDGSAITVVQNSLIGIDPASVAATGSSPLQGAAWGTFEIAADDGTLAGAYSATIAGTFYLDPFSMYFGCPALEVTHPAYFGPIDFDGNGSYDPYGAFVGVEDHGGWEVTGATGELEEVHDLGGTLQAIATGCLGGPEVAELTLHGKRDNDHGPGKGKGHDRGGDEEDDEDDEDEDDEDEDDTKGKDTKGKRGR